MPERGDGGPWGRWIPRAAMLAGVLAWLWPIGLGGQMLVGGDSTQFSLGLMAFLRASLLAGRLPLWNDLWGFGFPGLAESQMGVFYPPHLLLYGTMPAEYAYVASQVLHLLWAALGASWAARRFGTSEVGAALAGFAWATCGVFLVHLSHQWAYTVGSWMPWAWGLAWTIGRGSDTRRTPWLLAAVLAVQVLPGHFQLAFVTEVGCLALGLVAAGRSVARSGAVALAVMGMLPLAAMQLWPTLQLARLSGFKADFEYLSGFAASPLHFVSLAAPGLFHRSPYWRPVAWDPFQTSPEEVLTYIGLVPLFLALGMIARGWRADPGVRALAIVAGLTLFLSLGPYAPGFGRLIRLPGFSFFRAPARWGLATSLALAILAGRGFDALPSWPGAGRAARRFAVGCLVAVVLVVLGFELALAASRGNQWGVVASGFDRAFRALPWSDRSYARAYRAVMAEAFRPQDDIRTQSELARLDRKAASPPGRTLATLRFSIYARELGESAALLAALTLATALATRPRAFAAALLAIAAVDPLILARHRPFDFGPARPLVEQSPVLSHLAREPRGTRTFDPGLNLFMIAGVDGAWAYRTLDLPAPHALFRLSPGRLAGPQASDPLRVAGIGIRVLDPMESRGVAREDLEYWWDRVELFRDPALVGWIMGVDYVRAAGFQDLYLLRPREPASRAWLLPAGGPDRPEAMADPRALIEAFRPARPLPWRSEAPERVEVDVPAGDRGASLVVLSSTYDPEWTARWEGGSGERRAGEVTKVLGGWQGVAVPGPGRWTLHLEYEGRAARTGLAASAVAWALWLAGWVVAGRGRRGSPASGMIEAASGSEGGS